MAVTPIEAHCRRCLERFYLFELLDDRTGRCPRCGRTLSQDWVPELLRQARTADITQRRLIASLRGLRDIPGNLMLRPHTVLRNLFEEVGWQRDLAENPAALREELRELHRLLAEWEQLAPQSAAPRRRRGWFRRLLDALIDRDARARKASTDAANVPRTAAVATDPSTDDDAHRVAA